MSGVFIHHPDGYIVMNGERFSLEVFLQVEPAYKLPDRARSRFYEQGSRHTLNDGKNEWKGPMPWTQGDIYINRLNDFILMRLADEMDTADAEEAAEFARFDQLSPAEKRKRESPLFPEMVEALWRHVVEGEDLDTSGCNAIQEQKNAVRKQYPDV